MKKSSLQAGAAVTDITPPLEVGLLTSSVNGTYAPFESVRLTLKARILVLSFADELLAFVSLDLLALNDTSVDGWENFKAGMAGQIQADKIILTCTHTHTAPESVALSNLYLTKAFKNWLLDVQLKIKTAITSAADKLKLCHLSVGIDTLHGFNMQRRIYIDGHIIMSDSLQPIDEGLLNRGPVDRRVKVLRFSDDDGNVISTIVQAICHPVHEMCMKHISSEFPGEMCCHLESLSQNGIPMFLNGAAGDTNPPTVSMGPRFAQRHGVALGNLVQQMKDLTAVDTSIFRAINSVLQLPMRQETGITNAQEGIARFNALRIGTTGILFLPGEPFIETAWAIEKDSPFQYTVIIAYSENNIGYIPTEEAFDLGGYEAGPGKWSYLEKGTDKLIYKEAIRLLHELNN
jgi:neutral ceramidase